MAVLKRVFVWSAILAAVTGSLSCGSQPVIGVLLPLTGEAASYGASMKNAISMALEAVGDGSAAGTTAVVWADSTSVPSTAAERLRGLAADHGAKLVVSGTTSTETTALLEVFEDTDSLGLSPSAPAAELTKKSKRFFRVLPSDDLEGRRAGRFLAEERSCATAAVLTGEADRPLGIEQPFREMFEQSLAGKVTGRIDIATNGWRDQVDRLIATDPPDGIYVIGLAHQIAEAIRQLRTAGYQGVICTTSALNSAEVIANNAEILDDIYFPQPNFDLEDQRSAVQDFVVAYRERFGHDPDIYAAHAYDAIRLALQAVDKASVYNTEVLRQTLQFGITEFPGVTGVIRFNDYGDIHRNPIMFIVRDGQVRNFERYLKEEKQRIRDRLREMLRSG